MRNVAIGRYIAKGKDGHRGRALVIGALTKRHHRQQQYYRNMCNFFHRIETPAQSPVGNWIFELLWCLRARSLELSPSTSSTPPSGPSKKFPRSRALQVSSRSPASSCSYMFCPLPDRKFFRPSISSFRYKRNRS